MARFITVAAFFLVAVAAVSAQDFFGGNQFSSGPRDARQNRGPVTFPVTSPGSETSGVRVGASGYGFVPPGSRGGIGPHGAAGPNPGFGFYPGFNSFYCLFNLFIHIFSIHIIYS
ncbi:hypothetical protein GE061_016536 [Apolygus lucorum]|uniref:Uncharacterized protein n=1 Tax=Apolygus lucorum TaxID=248454 RepID=A0A8S9XJ46_APOLU|nr:hypothetical protein GE061_016536 [Apolygus lucorum]